MGERIECERICDRPTKEQTSWLNFRKVGCLSVDFYAVWVRFEWKVSSLKVQFKCTANCPQAGACALGLFCTLWVNHKCAFLVKSELALHAIWVHGLWTFCILSEIYECRVCILTAIVTAAVLVKLARGEASRGRPDTIRRPFPVISGASKCDGDCDDRV